MEDFKVAVDPFRIIYKEHKYRKIGKVRKNFRGKYRCEMKFCPVGAEIDKKGILNFIPGKDRHSNHQYQKLKFLSGNYESQNPYIVSHECKFTEIIVHGEKFISEHHVRSEKNYCGFYRCSSENCPFKGHIDFTGNFHYFDAAQNLYLSYVPHLNHPIPEYYYMSFNIAKGPLRVYYLGNIYIKDGKLTNTLYEGKYKCTEPKCKTHVIFKFFPGYKSTNLRFCHMTSEHRRHMYKKT